MVDYPFFFSPFSYWLSYSCGARIGAFYLHIVLKQQTLIKTTLQLTVIPMFNGLYVAMALPPGDVIFCRIGAGTIGKPEPHEREQRREERGKEIQGTSCGLVKDFV